MPARPTQPAGHGQVMMAEDALSSGGVDPFRQSGHDHRNPSEGSFEPVEGCAEAAGAAAAAGLALQIENALFASTTIANEGVDFLVGDGEVVAKGVEAGKAAGIGGFGSTPTAFSLWPGEDFGSSV